MAGERAQGARGAGCWARQPQPAAGPLNRCTDSAPHGHVHMAASAIPCALNHCMDSVLHGHMHTNHTATSCCPRGDMAAASRAGHALF